MFLNWRTSGLFGIESRIARPSKSSRARLLTTCTVVFLTACGVRLLYWQDNSADLLRGRQGSGLQMMTTFYYDQAQRIVDDGGILFPGSATDPGDATILTHPPGYSILMSAIFRLFGGRDARHELTQADSGLRVVQIIGDGLSCVVVFLIAAELFPVSIAVIAALLGCFSPHFAYYSLMLAPDTLSVLPILLAIYFLIRASKQPRVVTVLIAGALLGLSCWLRSNALLLAPFLVLIFPLLFERGRRLRYSLALAAAMTVVISPILIRNWIVFHRFVPLSVMAGLNLVEGIGDYDKENKFDMPRNDAEAAVKDAEWHGRPDYADSLWKPEGFERDKDRFARGLGIVRSNPGWFLGVMLRRMEFMLRYNDLRQPDLSNIATAPTLSKDPNFGHKVEIADEMTPLWSSSAVDLLANGSVPFDGASTAPEANAETVQITVSDSSSGDFFSSEPLSVKKHTDYLLRLAVSLEQGKTDVKVGTADPRIVLALVPVSDAVRRRKPKVRDQDDNSYAQALQQPASVLLVPFASGDDTQVRLSLHKPNLEHAVVTLGRTEMFEIGPTPYQWTRYPRAVIRGVQKNLFKTTLTRVLIVGGIILLALARRGRALAILLIVPVYFLLAQSPLHTEYRYILAIHYFLFVMAAATIYYAGAVIVDGSRRAYLLAKQRREG
jgi:hypothetical protein